MRNNFRLLILLIFFGALASVAGASDQVAEPVMEVTFLDVGHGDCIYVDLPDRPDILYDDILVDGGDGGRGAKAVAAFLKSRGEQKVDLVFVTHGHSDHCGGLVKILKPVDAQGESDSVEQGPDLPPDGEIEFDHLYYNGSDYPTGTFRKLMELAGEKSEAVGRGDSVDLDAGDEDEVSLRVLNPPKGELSKEENDNSLVLLLSFGNQDFLLTGDVEKKRELELVDEYGEKLGAEVLKVPHHGSDTSSSEPFVAAVSPRFAVVCTDGKRYHLPKEEIMERYRRSGAEILRTDEEGNVTFLVTKDSLSLRSEEPSGEPGGLPPASAAGGPLDTVPPQDVGPEEP